MELRSIRRMIQQDRKITDSVPESGTLDFKGGII